MKLFERQVNKLVVIVIVKSLFYVIHGRALEEDRIKIENATETDVKEITKALDVDFYLEKYGYLVPPKSGTKARVTYSEFTRNQAIKDFQTFANLKVTGNLNDETISAMRWPRCGNPDVIPLTDPGKPQEYNAGPQWSKSTVRWEIQRHAKNLTKAEQRSAFENAFKRWSSVSGIQVVPTDSVNFIADISIKFATDDHGDGFHNAFDGQGGVLGHAFSPSDGRVHFDDEERWVYHSNNGVELETVATHEFGHALGLSHSSVQGSVMAPFNMPYQEDYKLHADDIAGIQSLYGPPPAAVKGETSKTTKPKKAKNIDLCNTRIDAITRGSDGFLNVFIKKNVYKLKDYCEEGESCIVDGFPIPIRKLYKKGPNKVSAAAYIPDSRRRTYLFKGNKVWRYTKYKLNKGYPKKLNSSDLPYKPTAAYVQKNQFADYQLYIFGSKYFWELNLYTEKIAHSKMLVKTYWDYIPNKPDAVIQTRDGSIYVFKGKSYRKYDHLRDAIQKKMPIGPAWFGGECGFNVK